MAEAARSQGVPPEPRASFLTDPFTSRDLFGVCRGRCLQCTDCGKYLKATADYTVNSIDQGRRHPDNDPGITRCSRCGCPPEAHEVAEHEQERELGNDAFALRHYDAAVTHYSRALGMCATDAALWSNRAAAYLAKGWPQQALSDAEHALALRPDWPKAWGRKAAALLQLGRPAAAVEAYQRGLQLDQAQDASSGGSTALREGLRQAQAAVAKQQKAAQRSAQPGKQPPPPPSQQQQQQRSHAPAAGSLKTAGGLKASSAGTSPPAPVRASSPAPPMPQRSSSAAAQPVQASSASPAPAQQWQPQLPSPDLLAAWQALQQQATEAAAALALLQRQMQAFEGLLLAAHQPAGEIELPPAAVHGTSAPSLVPEDSSAVSAEGSQEAPATGTAAAVGVASPVATAVAGVPSPDTAAPLEASHPLGSSSSGLFSSLGSLDSLPSSPAAAPAPAQGEADNAADHGEASVSHAAWGGARGGGDSTSGSESESDSDSDSGVEEVYSEAPPAPVAAAAAAAGTPSVQPVLPNRDAGISEDAQPAAAAAQAGAPAANRSAGSADGSIGSGSSSGHTQSSPRCDNPASSASTSNSSHSSSGTDDEDESSRRSDESSRGSDDDAWLASVEAARRRLAAEGARMTPPAKAGRRAPKPVQVAAAVDGGLASLRKMCADAEAAAMAVDASGIPRASCKQCGEGRCPRFRPAGALSEAELAAVLAQRSSTDGGFGAADACIACGCPSSAHETPREFATRQARERRQRLRAQRQSSGAAAAAASSGAGTAAAAAAKGGVFQPESLEDRQRRVAAVAGRRAAAEATGDVLQDSDCDMLTQQRRTTCGGCSACPGFRLLFRTCDANDPEVMFYCSACGCRSDQHAVDAEWQRNEAARRAAAAAASERQQAAGATGGRKAAAVRKKEAEAFATLNLPLGADAKSITRAYKRLALQLHPDKQQRVTKAEAEAAAERFVRVAAAYKLLSGS